MVIMYNVAGRLLDKEELHMKYKTFNFTDCLIKYLFRYTAHKSSNHHIGNFSYSSHWRHMSIMASHITVNSTVSSSACSGHQQREHQHSALLNQCEGNLLVTGGFLPLLPQFRINKKVLCIIDFFSTHNILYMLCTSIWIIKEVADGLVPISRILHPPRQHIIISVSFISFSTIQQKKTHDRTYMYGVISCIFLKNKTYFEFEFQ